MKLNLKKKYLVLSDLHGVDCYNIITGAEVNDWLKEISIEPGDKIYELGREYEVGSVKVVKEKK